MGVPVEHPQLTSYDAQFVALAVEHGTVVVTVNDEGKRTVVGLLMGARALATGSYGLGSANKPGCGCTAA